MLHCGGVESYLLMRPIVCQWDARIILWTEHAFVSDLTVNLQDTTKVPQDINCILAELALRIVEGYNGRLLNFCLVGPTRISRLLRVDDAELCRNDV